MTLRHMRIFYEVCRQKTVTKAAEVLHLSQPAVSLAIRELEDYYGIRLFDRIGRRLHLTEAGKNFLSYAQHITVTFDAMETGIRNWDYLGLMRIGCSISLGTHLLPTVLRRYADLYPNMRVEVTIDSSEVIESQLLDNTLDLALIEGPVHSAYLKGEPFYHDRLVMICSPSHPFARKEKVTLDELLKEPFLLREMGSGTRAVFDAYMQSRNRQIKPLWQSTSTRAIVKAVEANLGISVLPYQLVKHDIVNNEVAIIEFESEHLKRSCQILHHQNKFLTPGMKEFIRMAKEAADQLKEESLLDDSSFV